MDPAPKYEHVGRRKPAAGVHIDLSQPTIVFITVCTENRVPWVAQPKVHKLLVETWKKSDSWLVGYYLLMPDHVHLFCAPVDIAIPLNRWMSYWKRLFTQNARKIQGWSDLGSQGRSPSPCHTQNPANWRWQSNHWDTRLRRTESYQNKWNYIRENPMKAGLARTVEDWPYQGMMNVLRW